MLRCSSRRMLGSPSLMSWCSRTGNHGLQLWGHDRDARPAAAHRLSCIWEHAVSSLAATGFSSQACTP